jgi:hypothetical protein
LRRFTNSGIGFPDPSWVINALRSSLGLPLPRPSFNLPDVAPVGRLPRGGVVELSGRGSTYVVDSGPAAGGPTLVLLHSLACTGLLTWYPSLEMLRRFGRVVVLDQRWDRVTKLCLYGTFARAAYDSDYQIGLCPEIFEPGLS